MSKLSPAEAWKHVKALWPEAAEIRTGTYVHFVMVLDASKTSIGSFPDTIDWPEGVDRWPPTDEWRDAVMPQDWNKHARFRNGDEPFSHGVIAGYIVEDFRWIDHWKRAWETCQVRVEPEAK